MSLRFAVVHEAEADFHTAAELADRALVAAIDWLGEDLVADQRRWVVQDGEGHRLTWKAIAKLARDRGIPARGGFDGKPGKADAVAARRAILWLQAVLPDLSAIVLIRDQDDQPERRIGLEQARNEASGKVVIIIGLAIVERECWVISGFDPEGEEETSRLESERKSLGFDPRRKSHELTACKDDRALRSPKRVLRSLCGSDRDRERRCWANTELDELRDRGGGNGLAVYLQEVRERLAPLIGYVANR